MLLARLPVPHLFMGLSVGIVAVVTLTTITDVGGRAIAGSVAFPVLLTATVKAGRTDRHRHGRPVLALISGLLTGYAGASSLVGLGILHPGGPHVIYLPLVFATLGTVFALSAGTLRSGSAAAHRSQQQAHAAAPDLTMSR